MTRAPIASVALAALGLVAAVSGCVTSGAPAAGGTPATVGVVGDTTERPLVPAGFGTLRQDEVSLHVQGVGVMVRALPLDEGVLRLLTPDSYRALRDLRESSRAAAESVVRRYGMRRATVWLVSFFGLQPNARFTPGDLIITSAGRDFRPYEIVPLTVGFGEQRLAQRETQSALVIYDGEVNVEQPLSLAYEGARDDSWEEVLQRLERERTLVRARAGRAR